MIEFIEKLNKLLSLSSIESISLNLLSKTNAGLKFHQALYQMIPLISPLDMDREEIQLRGDILLINKTL
jgi:hypothetical protein